jgi:glutathione synthase|tara:strand:- start:448 stop:1368 length:921 start_codon:yes stop_codon:yes gene_type:complete
MKFLFVIDPIEKLNLATDSSIEIMNECSKKNIEIYYCETKNLFFDNKKVYADSTLIKINNKEVRKIKNKKLELDFFNLVLMRKEPPYDLNYHYATMLLEKTKAKVINNPQGLRNANEKLVILNFPSIIPATIVTKEEKRIIEFVKKHRKAVIKPIHLFGGKEVSILDKNDKQLKKKVNKIIKNQKNFAIVQEFIDEIYKGDKRIFLLDGKPLGGIVRIPKKGDFRANMVIGGKPIRYKINNKDKKIINTIKPYLIKHGLALVGIDIIKDKLIEINVTCPTGLVPIKELDKKNITKEIVDYLIDSTK